MGLRRDFLRRRSTSDDGGCEGYRPRRRKIEVQRAAALRSADARVPDAVKWPLPPAESHFAYPRPTRSGGKFVDDRGQRDEFVVLLKLRARRVAGGLRI
jgi:hypothetical protein